MRLGERPCGRCERPARGPLCYDCRHGHRKGGIMHNLSLVDPQRERRIRAIMRNVAARLPVWPYVLDEEDGPGAEEDDAP